MFGVAIDFTGYHETSLTDVEVIKSYIIVSEVGLVRKEKNLKPSSVLLPCGNSIWSRRQFIWVSYP